MPSEVDSSAVAPELLRIARTIEQIASNLDGLANNGVIWREGLADADKNRFAWALRTNARTLRDLSRDISGFTEA